ncbi:MAG: hypothetical protein WCJ19_03280 [bacterium]
MNIASKIKYILILLTIFFLPLAFNPNIGDTFSFFKGVFLITMTSLILLAWGAECFISKKLIIKFNWVNTIILLLLLTSVISVISNTSLVSGLFGQGNLTGLTTSLFGASGYLGTGSIIICTLIVFYFAVSTTVDSNEKINGIIRTLGLSGAVVVIISLIRYILPGLSFNNNFDLIIKGYNFINPSYPTLYPSQNFSPIGEYYLMPLFLLVSTLMYLKLIELKKSEKKQIFVLLDYLVLFVLISGFIITTWGNAYSFVFYLIGAVSFAVSLLTSKKSILKSRTNNLTGLEGGLVGAISVVFSAGIIIIKNIQQVTSPLISIDSSWSTAFSSLGGSLKNGFFGVGPENFGVSYLLYRPTASTNTNIVFESINHAGNYILEILTNYGLIGLFIFCFIFTKIFIHVLKNKDTEDKYFTTFALVLFVIGVSMFFVPFNTTILFVLIIVFVLLSSISNTELGNSRNLVIALKGSSNRFRVSSSGGVESNVSHYLFLTFTILVSAFALFVVANLYISQNFFSNSYKLNVNINNNASLDSSINETLKAVDHFAYSDQYYNRIALFSVQKLYNYSNTIVERQKKEQAADPSAKSQLTAEEQANVQQILQVVNTYIQKSIDTNPLNYGNYFISAKVWIELAKNSSGQIKDGYLQKAEKDLGLALSLNPQNASLISLAADLYIMKNQSDSALKSLVDASVRIPDVNNKDLSEAAANAVRIYASGLYYNASLIYLDLKLYDQSIAVLTGYQEKFTKADTDIYNQVTEKITQVKDLKAKDPEANKQTTNTTTTVPTPTVTVVPTISPTPKK